MEQWETDPFYTNCKMGFWHNQIFKGHENVP